MSTYVKLYGSIIHSSIWAAPDHVRLVWITMLAMADMFGKVEASIVGIAGASRVSVAQAEEAINILMGPDPHSKDGTTGERIAKVDRGWEIINHGYYRDLRSPKQVKWANDKARQREAGGQSRTVRDVHSCPKDSVYVSVSESSGSGERRESERGEATPKKRKPREKREESSLFIEFMDAYAKKLARSAAWAKWQEKIGDDEELARRVIKAAFAFAKKPDSVKNNRQFQPYPATWLNQERWKDEVAEPTAPKLTAEEEAAAERERMAEEFDHDFWRREAEEDAKRSRHQREVEERIWRAVGCPDATQFRWRIAGHPGASEAQRQELKEVGL